MRTYIVRQAPGHGIVGEHETLAAAIAQVVKLSEPAKKGECSYWIEKMYSDLPVLYDSEITLAGACLLLGELMEQNA